MRIKHLLYELYFTTEIKANGAEVFSIQILLPQNSLEDRAFDI